MTTLSNLSNLNLVMMNDDNVQIPQSDNIKVIKTKPFYNNYFSYSPNNYYNYVSFALTPQPYQLRTDYINVSCLSDVELIID